MTPLARALVVLGSLVLFLFVVRMVRRRTLTLEYSILWLLMTGLGVVAGIAQPTADAISRWIGISYPPAFYFLICIFVLLSIVLHLTIRLSRMSESLRNLAQEIALLRAGVPESAAEEEATPEPRRAP